MEHLKTLLVGLAAMGAAVLCVALLIAAFPWSLVLFVLVVSYGTGVMLRETGW